MCEPMFIDKLNVNEKNFVPRTLVEEKKNNNKIMEKGKQTKSTHNTNCTTQLKAQFSQTQRAQFVYI